MNDVRKCSKCGGNVPYGNEVCNNCGQKVRFFTVKTVNSGNKSNPNTIPSNPFETKKNNNGCFIFFLIFFIAAGLPIFTIGFKIFGFVDDFFERLEEEPDSQEYTCSLYCDGDNYVQFNDKCICSNGNIYDEDGELEYESVGSEFIDNNNKCTIYCDDMFGMYNGNSCTCPNGTYYDLNGNLITDSSQINDGKIDLIINDIDTSKKVFVYITGTNALGESDLKNVAATYSNITFHYVDSSSISDIKLLEFRSKYGLPYYSNSHYYTFESGKLISHEEGNFALDDMNSLMSNLNQ